jgi:hypothetical protein
LCTDWNCSTVAYERVCHKPQQDKNDINQREEQREGEVKKMSEERRKENTKRENNNTREE